MVVFKLNEVIIDDLFWLFYKFDVIELPTLPIFYIYLEINLDLLFSPKLML